MSYWINSSRRRAAAEISRPGKKKNFNANLIGRLPTEKRVNLASFADADLRLEYLYWKHRWTRESRADDDLGKHNVRHDCDRKAIRV